jgi:glycosyltransferase involved in cell wall biosynthesis
MQHDPQVTVLMPVYNAGAYVAEAIESVLTQTWRDFEFLVINDGSTDDTLAVIKRYNDPRIKLIDQKNKGLIDTLNEGILISKGEIIARMDGDDVCLPNRLEAQLEFLKQHPDHVMVGSEADVMDKDGNYLMHLVPIAHSHEEIVGKINLKCPFIHPCVTFYKKAVIDAGEYPANALTFEDHLLWKKLLTIGKVCNLREILLKVRFNPESVTIDEKWRGPEFIEMRRRSIENGFVSEQDAAALKRIIKSQNLSEYKQASYYAMVAKKYLWDNPDSTLARKNLKLAIGHYPKNKALYALYMFSYFPAFLRKIIYNTFKKKPA